jgi:hypothetical protein
MKETPIDKLGSFWTQYKGNSIGRTIHYLYNICGLNIAEEAIFCGNGIITYSGEKFAIVNYADGYPHLTFVGLNKEFYTEKQELLLKGE